MYSWGSSSGYICSSFLEAMVVMRMFGAVGKGRCFRRGAGSFGSSVFIVFRSIIRFFEMFRVLL